MTQAETEAALTMDAFDMWFAEKAFPEAIRGLLRATWIEAWLQGQKRGTMRGMNAFAEAHSRAMNNNTGA